MKRLRVFVRPSISCTFLFSKLNWVYIYRICLFWFNIEENS